MLTFGGNDLNDICENLNIIPPEDEDEDMPDVFKYAVKCITDYFNPKQNTEFNRYSFRHATQNDTETVSQFHSRLQQLAQACSFAEKDVEIKSQIISGSANDKVTKRGLSDPDMTLDRLIEYARSLELTDSHSKNIREGLTESIQEVHPVHADRGVVAQRGVVTENIHDQLSTYKDSILLKCTKIVLPSSVHSKAVSLAHEGHQGINKTKSLLREKVWFHGIDKLVENHVKKCCPCQSVVKTTTREPLQMTKLPTEVWSEISVDMFGPLPCGQYMLVIIDDCSRFPEVEICSSTSSREVIPKLDKVFATHGIPSVVRTDNGTPFQSEEFNKFASGLGFCHRKVTPLWPEANGEVESFMKVLKKLCQTAHLEDRPWKQALYSFLRNYRSTPHCSTGAPPAEILFGRLVKTKFPQISAVPTVKRDIASRDDLSKCKMKQYAEARRAIETSLIDVGDKVLMKNKKGNKLVPYYDPNPFKVMEKKGSMLVVQRGQEVKARNSSHFKAVSISNEPLSAEDDWDIGGKEMSEHSSSSVPVSIHPPVVSHHRRYPARVHSRPVHLQDYV